MILDNAARYDRIRAIANKSKYKRRELLALVPEKISQDEILLKSKGGVASNDSNSGFDREYLVLFIWEE